MGLASRLIHDALDDVRARGITIVAQCPFVRAYVERHPEVADLLAPADGGAR
jgi:predicted GNAT family acetyltransferase